MTKLYHCLCLCTEHVLIHHHSPLQSQLPTCVYIVTGRVIMVVDGIDIPLTYISVVIPRKIRIRGAPKFQLLSRRLRYMYSKCILRSAVIQQHQSQTQNFLLQILFMVGKGCLKPDMSLLKKDTPKALKRLLQECIKFNRDERGLFPQVCCLILKVLVMTIDALGHV